jgi:hypothetical protein
VSSRRVLGDIFAKNFLHAVVDRRWLRSKP